MKSEDIVKQLAVLLPKLTDSFTTNVNVTSLTRSGTTVTAVTDIAHGLSINQQVNVTGAETPLTVNSLTRSGTIGTLVTDNPHDLTENYSTSVKLTGSTEPEFNGEFVLLTVPNRYTVTFIMPDSGPTTSTGSPLLLNGFSYLKQYNGLHAVTSVPTTTSFTYEITDNTLYTPAAGTIVAKTNPRVSAAISLESAVAAYTKQEITDLWAIVVLGDVVASRSRGINIDSVDNIQRSDEYKQSINQPFSILVFFPTSDQIAGRKARDDAETMFRVICQSILGTKFNSRLFVGAQHPVHFTDHGAYAYTGAYYAHVYNFETIADLTFDDTIGYDDSVAFRDIAFSQYSDIGTAEDPMTVTINLDDS